MRSERIAQACANHPALLCMLELETLRDLSKNANARDFIGFDKHLSAVRAKEAG